MVFMQQINSVYNSDNSLFEQNSCYPYFLHPLHVQYIRHAMAYVTHTQLHGEQLYPATVLAGDGYCK